MRIKSERECREATVAELRRLGATIIGYGRGSRHPFVEVLTPTGSVKVFYSGSRSDHRAVKNSIAGARRIYLAATRSGNLTLTSRW